MAVCLECEKEFTPSSQEFMSAAGAHSELCPECAATAAMVEATPRVFITPTIIIINLIIFAGMIVSGVSPINPNVEQLLKWGADFGPFTLNGQWWRLLSSTFVHGGAWHLALNMLCLWSLGRLAERMFGARTFLAIYLLSGLGGSVASVWWNPAVVIVGASGGVSGLAGGLVVFWRSGKLFILHKVVILTIVLLNLFLGLLSLFSGLRNSGISHVAHLGGLVIGLALGASLQKSLTWIEGSSRLRAVFAYSGVSLALLLGIGAAYKSSRPFIKLEAADMSLEAGNLDQAIANYKEALEIKPDLVEARYDLGDAYMKKGLHDEAIAAFKQTIEVSQDPGLRAKAHSNLGVIYVDKKLYEEAITSFKQALEIEPNDAVSLGYLGLAYVRNGFNDKAINAFKMAIEASHEPELRAISYYSLGLTYLREKLYDEAIGSLEKSIQLRPGDPDAYNLLGNCYMEKELYEKAVGAYQRALELRPDFADARAGLGQAYEDSGLYDQAIAAYQNALKSKPDDETLREDLRRVSMKKSGGAKNGRVK
jgi:rhomboid protease GluP